MHFYLIYWNFDAQGKIVVEFVQKIGTMKMIIQIFIVIQNVHSVFKIEDFKLNVSEMFQSTVF